MLISARITQFYMSVLWIARASCFGNVEAPIGDVARVFIYLRHAEAIECLGAF